MKMKKQNIHTVTFRSTDPSSKKKLTMKVRAGNENQATNLGHWKVPLKDKDKWRHHSTTLDEDAPVNAVSGGGVAGIGFGDDGEPGVKPKKKKKLYLKMLRRKKPQ